MTIGERVKTLRKELGLTLEKFANPIGIHRGSLSAIENDKSGMSDRTLLAICREYGVSERWLRDGEGEMFVPVTRNEKIARFAGELMKDETPDFRRQLVEILADLNDEQWDALADFAEKLANIKK
jgi:transcriptional regulator with XRE-family HTH domain